MHCCFVTSMSFVQTSAHFVKKVNPFTVNLHYYANSSILVCESLFLNLEEICRHKRVQFLVETLWFLEQNKVIIVNIKE